MSGLGQWKGILYDIAIDNDGIVCVWDFECFSKTWHKVDCMPGTVLELLMQLNIQVPLNILFDDHITVHFCDGYILISHQCFPEQYGKFSLVLYNMVLKSWKKIQVNERWCCSKDH